MQLVCLLCVRPVSLVQCIDSQRLAANIPAATYAAAGANFVLQQHSLSPQWLGERSGLPSMGIAYHWHSLGVLRELS